MSDIYEPIRLGMVGGGVDAFIGAVHRQAARLDGRYRLVAGALSSNAERSQASGRALGLDPERIYDDYDAMAAGEAARADGIEAVAIVTPNHAHFGPAKAFLEKGVHVLCDKPLTSTFDDALALETVAKASAARFLLTHNYTGYPMAREMRRLVLDGAIGTVRVVAMEYIQGWLATREEGKQAAWRLDPKRSGEGGAIGDIGTHAYNLACFVTGARASELAADLHSFGEGRALDDNAHIMFRFDNGAKGQMWASQVAIGRENGLKLRVIGDEGALEFFQEDPNKLWRASLGEAPRLLTRGGPGTSAAIRVPPGHPEGYVDAFATLYADFADLLRTGKEPPAPLPGVEDGVEGMRFVRAAVASANNGSSWTSLR